MPNATRLPEPTADSRLDRALNYAVDSLADDWLPVASPRCDEAAVSKLYRFLIGGPNLKVYSSVTKLAYGLVYVEVGQLFHDLDFLNEQCQN